SFPYPARGTDQRIESFTDEKGKWKGSEQPGGKTGPVSVVGNQIYDQGNRESDDQSRMPFQSTGEKSSFRQHKQASPEACVKAKTACANGQGGTHEDKGTIDNLMAYRFKELIKPR